MASDTSLQAIGAYLLAIARANPQDKDSAHVKLHADDSNALIALNTCLHEATESGTPTNEKEVSLFIPTRQVEVSQQSMLITSKYLRKSLLIFYDAANVFAGAISKDPEKRKTLCNRIEEILSASDGTDVQPVALTGKPDLNQSASCLTLSSDSSPQKPAASKLPELLSPIPSKLVGISSINSRPDPGRRSDHDELEEHQLMKCWDLMVRRENRSAHEALLSESSWKDFVSTCQFHNSNLNECKKLCEELLEYPTSVSDPFARALAFWQSATELEMRRDTDPLRPYFYRWQLVRFRGSIVEIARPPTGTTPIRKSSATSPSRKAHIPRLEIIAIVERMLKTPLDLSRYPYLRRAISRNRMDNIAESIMNKFDEAEHLRMMRRTFGIGVLALIPPSWQPFPFVWDHAAATVASHLAASCPSILQFCDLIDDSCMKIMRSSNKGSIPEQNLPWRNGELQQKRRMVHNYVWGMSYSAHNASLVKELATAKAQGLGLPKEYQSSIQAALDAEARRWQVPKGARSDAVFSYIHRPNPPKPSPPRKPLGSRRVSISCADVVRAATSKERSIALSPEKRKHTQVDR